VNFLLQNLAWVLLCGAAVIALVAWRLYMNRRENPNSSELYTTQQYSPTAHDPVTGNKVGIAHAITANFEGKTYFFESVASRAAFQRDPERYVHRHHRHRGFC